VTRRDCVRWLRPESSRVDQFNSAAYFEAHEVLGDVWRAASGPEKKFLQGLIQVAALQNHSKGNVVGARSLLARATKNLSGYPENHGGIQLPDS